MSTGELENRTLVCFASLAPGRQHQLPAAEERAALGRPASLPTLAWLIRGRHFFPARHHHPPHSPRCGHGSESLEGGGPLPPSLGDPSVLTGCCGYTTLGWGRVTDLWPAARSFAFLLPEAAPALTSGKVAAGLKGLMSFSDPPPAGTRVPQRAVPHPALWLVPVVPLFEPLLVRRG